jgi:hypothetical protein
MLVSQRVTLWLVVVVGLALSLIVGTGLKREYDHEIAAASARTQNLTRILEAYTRQSMRRVTVTFLAIEPASVVMPA